VVSTGLPPGLIFDTTGLLASFPTVPGSYTFTVTATGSSGAHSSREDTIVIAAASPAATASPVAIDFGAQAIGTTTASRTVNLSNTGSAPLSIGSVAISNPAAGFAIVLNSCSGYVLPLGGACRVDVTFSPTSVGPSATTLTFTDNAPDSPQSVSLTGAGIIPPAPVASVAPGSVDFGNQTTATTSAPHVVTLSNTGDAPMTVSAASVSGTNAANFATSSDGCTGESLAPAASCTVAVTFAPSATGSRSATLQFVDNAAGTPQSVALNGTGVVPPAPVASVAPGSVDFGSQTTGTASAPHVVTLSNSGNGPLTISATSVGGTNAADFGKGADSCTGQTLAPGASCSVSVTFSPSAVGSRSATLQFLDNAGGSPHTVSLAGTGVAPVVSIADLAVSIAATPNPVKPGSKVTYTITILNAGPSAALNVLLNDVLSSQSTFVSARPSQGTCVTPAPASSGTVSCSIGSIANGATSATQIVVTVIAKKNSITNTVTVSTTTTDPNLANNTASITTRVR
jgi:conserved repeat domain